jgi:hypothetical protein
MPHQPIPGEDLPDRGERERQLDSLILDFMLNEGWPWSVEEIGRELGNQNEAVDAVARLTDSGLVHRVGDFVFPTRTARRAAEIEIGTV